MIDVVKAERRHINWIANHMRAADREEVRALGSNPKKSLRNGFELSLNPMTAMIEGQPAGMFGVVPKSLVDSMGTPWLLGTDALYGHAYDWALQGPRFVADMAKDFRVLENIVSATNVRAIRFLRYLGFTIDSDPLAVGGVEFLRFRLAIQETARPA